MTIRLRVIDDGSFHRSKSGTVWGRIYFESGDTQFPGTGWSDLAVAFTSAWLDALIEIASKARQAQQVHFMDGPLRVDVSVEMNGLIKLEFVGKDVMTKTISAAAVDLFRDAISCAEELIAICKRHSWCEDTDYLQLVANVERAVQFLPV